MPEPRSRGDWASQARRALAFVRPYRSSSLVILGLAMAGAVLGAIEPLLLMYIIDSLTGGGATRALAMGLIGMLGIATAREAVAALTNWLTWRVRLNVQFFLLEATVGRLQSLPISYHRAESVGATMTRLDRGISGFVGALTEVTTNVLPAVAYLGVAVFVMLRLDWRLTLLVLAFAPLPALIGAWAANEQSARERKLIDGWSRIYSRFNEVLSGIVTVKSYTMEEEEKRRFLADVDSANAVVARGVGLDSVVGSGRNMVAVLARLTAIAFGGLLVIRGEITLGTVLAFLGYVGGLFGPVQGLTNVYQTLRRAAVSLDIVFSILDTRDDLGDAPDARPVPPLAGHVHFDRVSFGYTPAQRVLRDVDLKVQSGEVVAIVGPSGGGKSTLMALLQRLYDPTAGTVRVDGMDIRTLRQRGLRQQIGVVLQDALLFNDTIRNNIAYGRPGASDADVEACARAANAHEFITRMESGYDTMVGERGGNLSMGERQRVAIARALLKNPPILILDEATSALDAESESLVQEALSRLIRGRTTFVVAHRLATVVDADRILVLRNGVIEETGSHPELMDAGGYYASLVRRQTRGLVAA